MNPQSILDHAQSLGITLSISGDQIRYAPKSKTPSDFVETLKEHKEELLTYLSNHSAIDSEALLNVPEFPKGSENEIRHMTLSRRLDDEHLLGWASILADGGTLLCTPIRFVEAPLRTVTTRRASEHAARFLKTIAYSRLQQEMGGWSNWTPDWWKEREQDAIAALHSLYEAMNEIGGDIVNGEGQE